MSPRPAPPPDLAGRWLSKFFINHLAGERAASPKTISSYRDAMKLLLTWFRDAERIPPEKLRLTDIDRSFLRLQGGRGGSRRRRRRRRRGADAELLQQLLLLLGRQGLERVDLRLGRGLLRRRWHGYQGERHERRPQPGGQALPKHQNRADHCR